MKSSLQNKASFENTIAPPTRIGILGGGQLGQMMTQAAHRAGHQVIVYDVSPDSPAFSVADQKVVASFQDEEALRHFASEVDFITLEFENIPLSTLLFLEERCPLFPSAAVVRTCQDRLLEKNFLRSQGIPVAPFEEITSATSLQEALQRMSSSCILKTATLGYDGKGQATLGVHSYATMAWKELSTSRAILEKKITFACEASVIVARSQHGQMIICSTQENSHRQGILDRSFFPAALPKPVLLNMEALGKKIAEALQVIGLLTIEFFVLPDGSLLVNELAPRPHNSGHHTIESLNKNQFDYAIAAITGRPLLPPHTLSEAVMVNLLGDLWQKGEPDWDSLCSSPYAHLHLYGKKKAVPGRKMGHITFSGAPRKQLLVASSEAFLRLA